MKYYIALDVGGTTINSGIFGEARERPLALFVSPSHAAESREAILQALVGAVSAIWNKVDGEKELGGIGVGFPGPSDYSTGTSQMKGLGKFEAIRGFPLIPYLQEALTPLFSERPSIAFENDAAVFAMGVYRAKRKNLPSRVLCLTLGTGCGSTFLENGLPVRSSRGIPEDGMLYHLPLRDSTVDDLLSTRGLLISQPPGVTVRELADRARKGDDDALREFHRFGVLLGEAILPFQKSFAPQALILGGNISRASSLFLEKTYEVIGKLPTVIAAQEDFALLGAVHLLP